MSGTNLGGQTIGDGAVPLFIPKSLPASTEQAKTASPLIPSSPHPLIPSSPHQPASVPCRAAENSAAENRVNLFGVALDPLRMRAAIGRIQDWIEQPQRCRYVVTPNVDHVVMLQHHAGLRAAYVDADLVLADGWPVVAASWLLRQPVPERVPGSDLVPELCAAAKPSQPLRLFLLGAGPGVAQRAALNIHCRWPGVTVVGTYSPPLGFEHDRTENERILARIAEAAPQVLVVGLGAPKQELWVHEHRDRISAAAALCVGATIDFLAGRKRRAPRWLQRLGLEWCHRMLSEPRRLAARYARDAWVFPQLVWSQWRRPS
jgi:N-acetylglucosaminyldiphosphoundecaprenol N-acetyl-beta-D-mannosaminyltransferase